jgi:uridine kinase
MDASLPALGQVEDLVAAIRGRLQGLHVPLVVALDGRSGTGKSTLAARLAARVGAAVVPGDDFYAGGNDAAWARLAPAARADRCIDWRRLRIEALEPLRAGQPAVWHPFDFATGTGLATRTEVRTPAPVIVLDGVYSARPELRDMVDLAVLVALTDDGLRRRRLVAREGETYMATWHARWDAAEDHYFKHVCPPASFDLVVTAEGDVPAGSDGHNPPGS